MCEFCDKYSEKEIEIYNVTTDKNYPKEELSAMIYIDGTIGIDGEGIKGFPPDGLSIEINYCPMCGSRVGILDEIAQSIGFNSFSHMEYCYHSGSWTKEYRLVVNALLRAHGVEELD